MERCVFSITSAHTGEGRYPGVHPQTYAGHPLDPGLRRGEQLKGVRFQCFPLIPAKAGIQEFIPKPTRATPWTPAFAGRSGGKGCGFNYIRSSRRKGTFSIPPRREKELACRTDGAREAPLAFFVYILASQRNGTLYTGMTDDLATRMDQHKTKAFQGFTARYDCTRLVWYEPHESRETAFMRERQIKQWQRAWKLRLIEADNPEWTDLYETLNC